MWGVHWVFSDSGIEVGMANRFSNRAPRIVNGIDGRQMSSHQATTEGTKRGDSRDGKAKSKRNISQNRTTRLECGPRCHEVSSSPSPFAHWILRTQKPSKKERDLIANSINPVIRKSPSRYSADAYISSASYGCGAESFHSHLLLWGWQLCWGEPTYCRPVGWSWGKSPDSRRWLKKLLLQGAMQGSLSKKSDFQLNERLIEHEKKASSKWDNRMKILNLKNWRGQKGIL